jgi:hemerythrin
MALLDWKNEYSVDIQSIDKQHKKLFETVNQLHDAMKSGVGARLVPVILNSLVSYTRDHFADEEKLMRQAAYPAYASHKAEHDRLTNEVVRLVQDMEAGRVAMSMQLLEFLKEWLQKHILSTDKQYSSRLQAAGVR